MLACFISWEKISPFEVKDYLLCKACSSPNPSPDVAWRQYMSKSTELPIDLRLLSRFRSAASNRPEVLSTSYAQSVCVSVFDNKMLKHRKCCMEPLYEHIVKVANC